MTSSSERKNSAKNIASASAKGTLPFATFGSRRHWDLNDLVKKALQEFVESEEEEIAELAEAEADVAAGRVASHDEVGE